MITPQKQSKAAIAIVTWNNEADISDCLKNLVELPENWEIWVADNNSSDNTVEIIERNFPRVNLIKNDANLGFAAANNHIIEKSNTEYLLLLNPDTVAKTEILENCLSEMENASEIGVLGIKLTDEKGNLQETCFCFPSLKNKLVGNFQLFRFFSAEWLSENFANAFFDHKSEKDAEWLMGAFLFVRREAIEKAGKLPEDYFMFTEDMDWCFRIREAGYKIRFTPKYQVIHKLGQSSKQLPSEWRVEKTTLGNYIFSFKHYGWLKTKIFQMLDLVGLTYSIFRKNLSAPHSNEIAEWKIYRKIVTRSLLDSRQKIRQRLNQK